MSDQLRVHLARLYTRRALAWPQSTPKLDRKIAKAKSDILRLAGRT